MTQEEKLFNICSSDEMLVNQNWDVEPYKRINDTANDMRVWFICCEWLCNMIFTENTCVYYQRKYQDGEQDIQVTTELAKVYDARLFGYPGHRFTRRFIFWPNQTSKDVILSIQTKVNYKLHQWSYLPALISDIRVWPLRYDLIDKDKNECMIESLSEIYLPESW